MFLLALMEKELCSKCQPALINAHFSTHDKAISHMFNYIKGLIVHHDTEALFRDLVDELPKRFISQEWDYILSNVSDSDFTLQESIIDWYFKETSNEEFDAFYEISTVNLCD